MKLSKLQREKLRNNIFEEIKKSKKQKFEVSKELFIQLLNNEVDDNALVELSKTLMKKDMFDFMIHLLDIEMGGE